MRAKKPVKRKSKKQKEEEQQYQIKKRRRNKNSQTPTTIPSNPEIKKETPENNKKKKKKNKKEDEDGGVSRFYGCYLLTSLSPRFKGHTYIGFTVNPKRRIRQHNGEITSGAFQTKKKRPWEMVLCIHGFPSNVAALQFEWAWQHPKESVAVREAAASFKTLGGLANKIKLGLTMLTLDSWQSLNLTVSFFSTKYMKHVAGSPSLPHQMKLHSCSMDELPCYMDNGYLNGCDDEDGFDSNSSEVAANISDDRLESLNDDSMELNLPSIYGQSCTIQQKSSDDILPGDHTGSMETESSVIMGTLESNQSLHQSLVDVNGSNQSISSELLQPCEEFWLEDARASFPDLEEDMRPINGIDASENEMFPFYGSSQNTSSEVIQPCENPWIEDARASFPDLEEDMQHIDSIDASENEMFPFCGTTSSTSSEVIQPCEELWIEDARASFLDLDEDMQPVSGISDTENEMFPFLDGKHPSCHLPVDSPVSNGNLSDELVGFGKEIEAEELRGSFPIIEDHLQPRQQAGPSDWHQSSNMEDVAKKDEITCIVIDDITKEQCQATRARSPFRVTNTVQPLSSEGIEVIELCSPSPDFRITRGSKKKRVNIGFPDIIDLTKSPSFIQL